MNNIKASLSKIVHSYCEKYRNPQRPPFIVHDQYNMTDWYHTDESAKPGCYVFYSEDGEALYVGKASLKATIGSRLAAHDRRQPRAPWREKAASVIFITVPDAIEASSLEEFLIRELEPIGNVLGRKSS